MKVVAIIPIYNAGSKGIECLKSLSIQSQKIKMVLINSGHFDETIQYAKNHGFEIINILASEFDHAGTRQLAVNCLQNYEIFVFLTQDAILTDEYAISRLLDSFKDTRIGMAYGRQLPYPQANPIETHARLYNYPEISQIRNYSDHKSMGIKAAFCSNSFAAYRKEALQSVGGFGGKLIMGEDMITAAKMLLQGWAIAYVAEACVYHSHNYSMIQEFKRYFDIGVLHRSQALLLNKFARIHHEGLKYFKSEFNFLLHTAPQYLPAAFLRNILKFAAYQLGKRYTILPVFFRKSLSMHKSVWN